ncbi:MAG TPA: PilW family protein [Xanthomonadales bacterium]|nr:PilW family protein [Xanthomonadales bacterium]
MKKQPSKGFVLTELLVAGLLSAFLMLGLIQMAAGASRGLLLIESLSQTQQGGRFAIQQVREVVMPAGFRPSPWLGGSAVTGLVSGSGDGGPGGNDVLVVDQYSDLNCYGNTNGTLGSDGRPAFYLKQSKLEVTSSGNLAHTCHYGPDDGVMVRQINRQGLVSGVDSFQVLYAEDTDGNRLANRQVRAGHWADQANVVGIQVGLLVSTEKSLTNQPSQTFTVLDQSLSTANDGKLRQVWTATIPLFSRLR